MSREAPEGPFTVARSETVSFLNLVKCMVRPLVPLVVRNEIGGWFLNPPQRYDRVWRAYATLVRLLAGEPPGEQTMHYRTRGYIQGVLPSGVVSDFNQTLTDASPITDGESSDFPGYVSNASGAVDLYGETNGTTYLRLSGQQIEMLQSLLSELEAPLRKALGTPWRLVNLKCKRTPSTATERGALTWHTDAMPLPIVKALVYLGPIDKAHGTTEIRLPDESILSATGPAGSWLLFKVSELPHRGVPPQQGDRVILELTIAPAFRMRLSPTFPGANTQYPKYPWISAPQAT